MAKITPGPIVGQISGKVGTVVFSRGSYGSYLRVTTMPVRVQTAATLDVRGRFAFVSKKWAILSPENRLAWKTWAQTNPIIDRLGNSQTLAGNAAFVQLNTRILQALGAVILVPPVAGSPPGLTSASIVSDVSSHTATITFAATPLAANLCLAVWMAVCDSAGREYYRNLMKLVSVSSAAQATGLNVHTQMISRTGENVAGQRIFCELEVWSKLTGLVSGRTACDCVVTA